VRLNVLSTNAIPIVGKLQPFTEPDRPFDGSIEWTETDMVDQDQTARAYRWRAEQCLKAARQLEVERQEMLAAAQRWTEHAERIERQTTDDPM
jgi:hypothetical protein